VPSPWWEKKRAISLERKAHRAMPLRLANPDDAFLVVTEGLVTEPTYFDFLRRDLRLTAARVKVMPGDGSDPRRVIETAARARSDQERKARKGQLAEDEPAKSIMCGQSWTPMWRFGRAFGMRSGNLPRQKR
jgi:hypothetical protein